MRRRARIQFTRLTLMGVGLVVVLALVVSLLPGP